MREQNIEKLFKDSFSNFEADVNPSVWTNVEQSLPASPQNIPGHSPVAKPSGFFGKISLNTALLVAGISATLIGTAIYFSSFKSGSENIVVQNIPAASQPVQDNSPVLSGPGSVASQHNAPVNELKNTAAEKQTASVAKEKVYLNNQPQQTASETKTENISNSNSNSVQVSMEADASPAPSVEQKTTGGITAKLSDMVVQNTQQDAAKNSSVTSGDPSPATSGHLDAAAAFTEEEGISPAEYTDEFHFYIPNVFTPNGDMANDFFQPVANNSFFKDYEMVIYDRYGSEIFKSRDIAFSWDGKLRNGNEAASAVYVYKIKLTDFKDEARDYMGYVVLLK